MRRCLFRLLAVVQECLHCEHVKGFSPLWTSLWLFKLMAQAVEKLHWSQLCFFFKSARSLMLRSFVLSTVGFSMVWLCLCSIAARFDNNWQNLKGKEGKFWEKRKWGLNGICRPCTLVLCSSLWLRKEGEDNLYQLSPQASQSFGACLFVFSCPGQLNKWHCRSVGRSEPTNNQSLGSIKEWP